ncbi:MAG: transposase [Bacteroidia bacterium]|nr:transposase [Bacteroidia bacterium]
MFLNFGIDSFAFMEQIANKPARRRRSTHEILGLLDEFEKGGVSVKEFCIRHNISKAAFHKWQSRHKSNTDEQPGFADLHIIPQVANIHAALFAEVKGVRIYQPVSVSYLKELMA